MSEVKDRLRLMKLRDMQAKTPAAFIASGGFTMKVKRYHENTSSGLTKCVVDWINFSGGSANRINTQGQVRKERVEYYGGQHKDIIRFTKSTTRRGTADIHAVMNGRHLSIEIKIGKDEQSDHQIKEQARITSAGGLYCVARDLKSFVDWFEQHFPLTKNNSLITGNV